MRIKALPELELLKDTFEYDTETGEIKRKGKVAGWVDEKGYRRLRFKNRTLFANRVAWAIGNNQQPPIDMVVDHIDEDPSNNRLNNLRLLTISQNSARRSREPRCYQRNGTGYQACFTLGGVKQTLGTFKTAEEASKIGRAARKAAREL
jgi:hypothetical protein